MFVVFVRLELNERSEAIREQGGSERMWRGGASDKLLHAAEEALDISHGLRVLERMNRTDRGSFFESVSVD